MVQHFVASVLMQHLSSAEKHCELYLVTFFQKFAGMSQLDIEVVRICFGSEPDFLECGSMVLAFLSARPDFSFLLVEPLAIVHYAANRGDALGSDLDEVQVSLACFTHSHISFNYPHLIVRFVNQPNRLGLDGRIYP